MLVQVKVIKVERKGSVQAWMDNDLVHYTWYRMGDLVELRNRATGFSTARGDNNVRRSLRSASVALEKKYGWELKRDANENVSAVRKPAIKWSDNYIRGLLNDLVLDPNRQSEAWFADIYMLAKVNTGHREVCINASRTNHAQFEHQIARRFRLTPEQLGKALQRTFAVLSHHMAQQPTIYRVRMEWIDRAFEQRVTIARRGSQS